MYIYKNIPPHLAYVANTLPCETLMSAKQAINDKLQGSVATCLRCGGVVNNQIKEGLLLSLSDFFNSVNIWQSYQQQRDCLVHFLRLLALCWPGAHSARNDHVFCLQLCQIFTDFIFFTRRLSNKPFLIWLLRTQLRYLVICR